MLNIVDNQPLKNCQFVLAVASGKGGVGKSTVSSQLAYELHRRGMRVGLMDADIYGPSISLMLKEDEAPSIEGNFITPAKCQGISWISMTHFMPQGSANIVRAPIANGFIERFISQVRWGELDVLIVDFPPGTGDVQITLMQHLSFDQALIVTTPQKIALSDVCHSVEMFLKMQVPIFGAVENMSYYLEPQTGIRQYLFGKGSGSWLENELGIPLLAEIPIDSALSKASDHASPIYENQQSIAAEKFEALGQVVQEKISLKSVTQS